MAAVRGDWQSRPPSAKPELGDTVTLPLTPTTPQTPGLQRHGSAPTTTRPDKPGVAFPHYPLQTPSPPATPSPATHSRTSVQRDVGRSRGRPKNFRGDNPYLVKLLSLCRRDPRLLRTSHPAMADFLANFNLDDDTPSTPAQQHFEDVEGVQLQLQALIAGKTTQTRAEHVSTKLELSPNTEVTLSLTPSENEAIEGLNSVDPSLGGVRTNSAPGGGDGDVYTRTVVLNEAITHQPQNEPVLQRAIAKHLINALSAVDNSNWAVREVSKDTAGWKFVCLCRDSLKHWNRQSKSQAKMLVAEYTLKDLDPTVLNRPAFDCRGSLTIVFSRSSRAVIIDYEHTPMHKTVAELREHFKKPPRVLGRGAQKLKLQKTPKQTDGDKTPGKQKTPKQKTDGERIERKKRPREPGQDGATPRKRKKKSTTGAAAEGDVGQAGGGQDDGGAQSTQQTAWNINITPQEAQRRKENATKMLSEAGVDPESLSAEQFNIFANQSPDLQKESLAMLAKYGAERLRIVHPSASKTADSSPSAMSVQHAQPGAAGPTTTTEELVPALNPSSRKKKAGSRKSAGVTETLVVPPLPPSSTTLAETPTKTRKMAKSRVACYPCKNRKVKCPHERPTCAECQGAGLSCEYPPQKPRKSKKSEPTVVEDDDEDQDEVDNQLQEETQSHEGSGLTLYNQMPVADMLTANNDINTQSLDTQPTSFFPSAPSLSLPQTVSQFSQQTITTPSGLVLPHGHIYNNTSSGTDSGLSLPQESPLKQTPVPVPQPSASVTSPKASKRSTRGAGHGPRKSLPTKSSTSHSQSGPDPEPGAGWTSVNNGMATNVAPTQSPNLAQQPPRLGRQSRASSMRIPTNSPQQTMAQTASLQQQQSQRVHESPKLIAASQAHARNSPFQPVAKRSSSRQGHRSGPPVTSAYPPSTMAGSNGQGNSTYESYTRPSHNRQSDDQSVERVAYEPFTAHSSSSSNPYAAYDYNQINPGAGSGGRGTATTMAGSQWMATQNDGRSQNQSPVYAQAGYDQQLSTRGASNKYDGAAQASALSGRNQGRTAQNNGNNYYDYSQGQRQPQTSNNQSNWYGGYSNAENRFDWKGLGTPWSGN